MTKLTLEQQELLFANDCKLINLRYEYHGYTGTEKWAIVTELAEEELWVKYPDVIRRYTPFILLSMAQGEVIDESYRNNDKYEKRAKRTIDVYGYEDDISEQFHRELITPFVDPFEQAEEERIEEEKEQLRQLEIAKVRKVLEMLKPVQRERMIKAILFGQPQHQATLNKAIRRIIRDCNDEQLLKDENAEVLLPHFSCHSLRHTFTTRMCEAGVNVKVIQDTLGHKDISTTLNIYTDVTKELRKSEFEGLDSYFKNEYNKVSV